MAMSKLYKLGLLFPFILPLLLLHHHPVTCSSHAPLFPLNVRLESRDLLATLYWDPVEAAPSGDGGDRPPLVDPFTINSTTTTTTNSTFLNVTYTVQSKLFRRARWQTVCAATTETRCDVSSALDDPGGRYLLRERFIGCRYQHQMMLLPGREDEYCVRVRMVADFPRWKAGEWSPLSCVSVPPPHSTVAPRVGVDTDGQVTAVVGQKVAMLRCVLWGAAVVVVQANWLKASRDYVWAGANLATLSPLHGTAYSNSSLAGRLRFHVGGPPGDVSLELLDVQAGDGGLFLCHVATFPHGNYEGRVSLSVIDVDGTGSSRSTDVDATGSSRSTNVDATGSSRSTDIDATGSSRSTDVDATGSSRSADVDATGSSRSADVDATGSSRSTDVDATGSSRSTDVDATGSSRSTDVDATGSSRSTNVDATGSSRSTDVDVTGSSRSTDVDATGSSPSGDVDATGSSRSTDVDATGSSRSTDVDPTGSSRSTDVDATTAVCCTPVELTTFGPNRQLDTRTGKAAAAAGRASWAAPATILGVCLALVATLLLLMPLLYRRRRRRRCRQRRRRHEPWGPTEGPPTLPKTPRRNAEGHRGCLLALESGNKADEGLHGFPPQPLHQDGGAGSYGYAVFTDEDDDEAREEDF
ncbi:uncharacterized protein LOC142910231 isoform X2 [Petromyzon marinus]|uniref:uncharacterized protein LOC142910231 isoform X2 n=1 Tax=Petromyzon marinus TaxID=7757 RepID=UPI003F6E5D98